MTFQERIEDRRSKVRVYLTYGAGFYILLGSIGLIVADMIVEQAAKLETAREVFTLVLPVATGIITYWFASRKPPEVVEPDKQSEPAGESEGSGEDPHDNGEQENGGGETDDDAGKGVPEVEVGVAAHDQAPR